MITSNPSTWPTYSEFNVTRAKMLGPGFSVTVGPNTLYNNPTVHAMLVSGVPDVQALLRMGFSIVDANAIRDAILSGLYAP